MNYPIWDSFNGFNSRTIFCFWEGTMSPSRETCFSSLINNSRCPVVYMSHDSFVYDWQKEKSPIHPGYHYLSSTQKSDYVRGYMMHHYGGGYTDIKYTTKRWDTAFDELSKSRFHLGAGYTEIGPHGVAPIDGPLGDEMRANSDQLIGMCSFIFKPYTPLTDEWFKNLHQMLDDIYPILEKNPAQYHADHKGFILPSGVPSGYPIRWTGVGGDIVHPVVYKYRSEILHVDIAPQFDNYR